MLDIKLGFTGDLFLGETQENPFEDLERYLKGVELVINLESAFLPEEPIEPLKDKIVLKQNLSQVDLIDNIENIFLVNISNNHINDFGNQGVEETKQVLENKGFDYLGAGFYDNQNHHIHAKEDIVFFSYTTREADKSEEMLFNTNEVQGPRRFSLQDFKDKSKEHEDQLKIVLLHWGLEEHKYPAPRQRKIAMRLIDEGADLIIGNHPHRAQGVEEYNGSLIFYSLGNFFFPSTKIKTPRETYRASQNKRHNKISLLPIFDIEDGKIEIDTIIKTIEKNNSVKVLKESSQASLYPKFIQEYPQFYDTFYYLYKFLKETKSLSYRVLTSPIRLRND